MSKEIHIYYEGEGKVVLSYPFKHMKSMLEYATKFNGRLVTSASATNVFIATYHFDTYEDADKFISGVKDYFNIV